MIEFSHIYVEGFCSIESLNLPLNNNKVNLVVGSNGFGKTTILSAIIWCIYGKNIKGISDVNTWPKYRKKGYNGTKVELYFKVNNSTHKVIRCQNYKGDVEGSKGGSRLVYMVDADLVKEKYKPDIQKLITKNIGMSYTLFMSSIMFGQGLKRLIQETNADKKALFEEVFELGYLSRARDLASLKLDDIGSKRVKLESKLSIKKSKLSELLSSIKKINTIKKAFKKDKIEEIKDLKKSLKDVLGNISSISKGVSLDKTEVLIGKVEKLSKKLRTIREKLEDAKEQSSVNIRSLVKNTLRLIEEGNLDKAKNLLISIEKAFNDKERLYSKVDSYREKIDTYKEEYNSMERKLDKLSNLENKRKELEEEIESVKNKKLSSSDTTKLEEEADNISKEVDGLAKELDLIKSEEEDYEWAYKEPLGNNGLKAFLFESSLGELNSLLKEYSDVMGFLIQFNVNLNSTKRDFVTQIILDGVEVLYEELSGGQKQLVNLTMALAMNQVISSSKGINIAFLDEVFESLSQDNIEIVVSLIQKVYKGKTLFLITHHSSLPISNTRVIRVERVKGLSKYSL